MREAAHLPRTLRRGVLRVFRIASLLLLSTLGTVVLMRSAPGYFADARELDAEHAAAVRDALSTQQKQTALRAWTEFVRSAAHLDLGTSREFNVPVWTLLQPRLHTSLQLLVPAVLSGPLLALACATLVTSVRAGALGTGFALTATAFCAVPISAVALACLVAHRGGPAAVLLALVAARDFRFFARLLRRQAAAPHLLYARVAGVPAPRRLLKHLLWPMRRELAALLLTSFLAGLNALLPVEVIFGVPGVGLLAWGAAMNRDLPVLLAVTVLMALCIACASMLGLRNARQDAKGAFA